MKSEIRSPQSEGSPKVEARTVLVCFAAREEARPFQRLVAGGRDVKVILVGIGRRNADRAIRAALVEQRPALVLTSGSAGGLRPDLTLGTVVFDADPATGLEPALLSAGAKPARFYCSERVATTVAEKQALRDSTGADAVEMESEPIRAVCREQKIPSATIRVILDTAQEDLPLDFSQLLTIEQKMSYRKLALALLKSPGKIGALLHLRRQSQAAAEQLGRTLAGLL